MEKGTTRSPQPQNYMLPKVHVIHNSGEMAETSQAFHHFFFPGLHVFQRFTDFKEYRNGKMTETYTQTSDSSFFPKSSILLVRA
jgi:hypothetical protein